MRKHAKKNSKKGKIMSSEAIVVLVLIALAIGFVIWVRKNSRDYDASSQTGNLGEEVEKTGEKQ